MIWTGTRVAAAVLLACAACSGVVLWAGIGADPAAAKKNDNREEKKAKNESPQEAGAGRRCRGRVVTPEGKPVAGAKVAFVRVDWLAEERRELVSAVHTVAGRDGQFLLVVPVGADGHSGGVLMASVKGYGPGGTYLSKAEDAQDATVQLVRDDVPVEGRVVDLEGKPIAGVSVEVVRLIAHRKEDLGAWLEQVRKEKAFNTEDSPTIRLDLAALGLPQATRTDADGRFRLSGFGRERLGGLRFIGPTIERREVTVATRAVRRAPR